MVADDAWKERVKNYRKFGTSTSTYSEVLSPIRTVATGQQAGYLCVCVCECTYMHPTSSTSMDEDAVWQG